MSFKTDTVAVDSEITSKIGVSVQGYNAKLNSISNISLSGASGTTNGLIGSTDGTSLGLILNPVLTNVTLNGTSTSTTPTVTDSSTSIATTAFTVNYVSGALSSYALLNSPVFTGNPKAPTVTSTDNSTNLATTSFVQTQGFITSSALSPYAPLSSPTFTGLPKAPTVTSTDNSTSLATTAWVTSWVNGKGYSTTPTYLYVGSNTGSPTTPTVGTVQGQVAIGDSAIVSSSGTGSIAIGTAAKVGGSASNAVALGGNAYSAGNLSFSACTGNSTGNFTYGAFANNSVALGYQVTVNGQYGNVAGGFSNNITTNGTGGAISGGQLNTVDASNANISGGYGHNVHAGHSSISGGTNCSISAGPTYSTNCGGYFNTITGGVGNAAILGGSNNTLSGGNAVVLGGANNTASNTYTVAMGFHSVASNYGQVAYSTGYTCNNGLGNSPTNSQTSQYLLRTATTDASAHEAFLDNGSARIAVGTGQALTFEVTVLVHDYTTPANNAVITTLQPGLVYNNAGTLSLASPTWNSAVVLNSWSVSGLAVTVGTNSNNLTFSVQGPTSGSDTLYWNLRVRTVETTQ